MAEAPTPWIDVNEIKKLVSIETVLARYGLLDKLQRRGNNLRGLSPFRAETRPSFFVSLDGNKWNDFPRPAVDGKEVPGNIVGLVMALENCCFRDALVKLHELSGAPPTRHDSPAPTSGIVAATQAKVEEALASTPTSNDAFGKELKGLRYELPFLQKRGLSPERARYWGVGYCTRGLMKGRVIVPIKNRAGEIVAYTGRSLKDDDPDGKWRLPNGFHKSLELFGADRLELDDETRQAVLKYGIIVTEGCFDTIHLVENGFKNTVSTMGSDVSPQQRVMLVDPELNPTRRVTVFFDHDEGGRIGRKKLAGDLIYEAFVRYVDFRRLGSALQSRADPDQFAKEELSILLA